MLITHSNLLRITPNQKQMNNATQANIIELQTHNLSPKISGTHPKAAMERGAKVGKFDQQQKIQFSKPTSPLLRTSSPIGRRTSKPIPMKKCTSGKKVRSKYDFSHYTPSTHQKHNSNQKTENVAANSITLKLNLLLWMRNRLSDNQVLSLKHEIGTSQEARNFEARIFVSIGRLRNLHLELDVNSTWTY